MIAVTTKLAWYVARSSGIVAWATVTASILWGLTLSSRLVRKRGVPAWLLDLHRYLGTLVARLRPHPPRWVGGPTTSSTSVGNRSSYR